MVRVRGTLEPYKILYKLPDGTEIVIIIGGRGSGKTYEVSKKVAFSATIENSRCVIVRDEKALIEESILDEILTRYDTANENSNGMLGRMFQRMNTGIKDLKTKKMVVFTKGFRASNKKKKANLKGISDVDLAVLEEAEDIRDEEKFNTFVDSIRKEGAVIFVILNTPDITHFLIRRYFHCVPVYENGEVLEGFFDIIPKDIKGFVCVKTTFEDNIKNLPEHIIARYRGYGDKNSELYNPFYYYTAIKGLASTGRKGQILKHVKPIKLEKYRKLDLPTIYVQDFGTARPAGLAELKFYKNKSYCHQLNYLPLPAKELGKLYIRLGIPHDATILCDDAEPGTIAQLNGGWERDKLSDEEAEKYPGLMKGWENLKAAKKGLVNDGLSTMEGMELYAVEEDEELWTEVYNYIWATDRNGIPTGKPAEGFDHLIDPWRYGCTARERDYDAGIERQN